MQPSRLARRSRAARLVPAGFLVAALLLAGCSDSDSDDETTTGSSVPTTVAVVTTAPVDTRFTGEGSGEFCQFITTFTAGSRSVSPTATPAELEASFNESLDAIKKAAEVAPAEIKGDVVAIADTFDEVETAASAAGYDLTKVNPSALGALQSKGFLESVTRLQAYLTNICKTPG